MKAVAERSGTLTSVDDWRRYKNLQRHGHGWINMFLLANSDVEKKTENIQKYKILHLLTALRGVHWDLQS